MAAPTTTGGREQAQARWGRCSRTWPADSEFASAVSAVSAVPAVGARRLAVRVEGARLLTGGDVPREQRSSAAHRVRELQSIAG